MQQLFKVPLILVKLCLHNITTISGLLANRSLCSRSRQVNHLEFQDVYHETMEIARGSHSTGQTTRAGLFSGRGKV